MSDRWRNVDSSFHPGERLEYYDADRNLALGDPLSAADHGLATRAIRITKGTA